MRDALINPSTSIQSAHISSTSSLCHTYQVEVPLESTSLAAIRFCSTIDENWELHVLYNSSIQTSLTIHESSSIENKRLNVREAKHIQIMNNTEIKM